MQKIDAKMARRIEARNTYSVVLLTTAKLLTFPFLLALETLKIVRKIDFAKSSFHFQLSTDSVFDFFHRVGETCDQGCQLYFVDISIKII